MTPVERAAVAQLQDTSTKYEVAELRAEVERHESDIEELEQQ